MRIAIIRRNGFGDLLCTMPMCQRLKTLYPHSDITLYVSASNVGLTPFLGQYHDRVVTLPRAKMLGVLLALKERRVRFDLAYSAKVGPMKLNNLILGALGAKQRIAYVNDSWHSRLINCPVAYNKSELSGMHQALGALRLVDPSAQLVAPSLHPKIQNPNCLSSKDMQWIRDTVSSSKLPTLLISVSNNRTTSSTFPMKRWASILNKINQFYNIQIAISCLTGEEPFASELKELLVPRSFIASRISLKQLLALINHSTAALLGDGGVMHMAAAFNLPQLALFGQTNPIRWAPLSEEARWLYDPECIVNLKDPAIIEGAIERLQRGQLLREERLATSI